MLLGAFWGLSVEEATLRLIPCNHKTVVCALWVIGGEHESHGRGGTRWRLPEGAKPRLTRRWHGQTNAATMALALAARVKRLREKADELEVSLTSPSAAGMVQGARADRRD